MISWKRVRLVTFKQKKNRNNKKNNTYVLCNIEWVYFFCIIQVYK